MITKTKKKKLSLTDKALKGGRKAIKSLIEERKKTDDHLIISRHGKVVKVKARSL
jgi:hypothetical protein